MIGQMNNVSGATISCQQKGPGKDDIRLRRGSTGSSCLSGDTSAGLYVTRYAISRLRGLTITK
jgi:hypothetical protein